MSPKTGSNLHNITIGNIIIKLLKFEVNSKCYCHNTLLKHFSNIFYINREIDIFRDFALELRKQAL